MNGLIWMRRALVAVGVILGGAVAQADGGADDSAPQLFTPGPLLAGPWRGAGDYDLKNAGIRIHVKPGQHILILDEYRPAPYRRCRSMIQALVHDPKLGLMLIGRSKSQHTVIDDWDPVSTSVFPDMLKFYREQGGGWARYPVKDADFYMQPVYEPAAHRARWVFSFTSHGESWFSSYWFTFDRDGYVVVGLMSRGPGLDGLDAALQASPGAPVEVENMQQHAAPLPPPGDPNDYSTAFLAVMAEPIIGACQFQTPFGDSF